MGRRVYAIMANADPLPPKERRNYILAHLDGGKRQAAE
jgi:dihydrofolate reductase